MNYTPNALNKGDLIKNIHVDNWDHGIFKANNPLKAKDNLLPDKVAFCTDMTLFTNNGTTDSQDTVNRLFSTSCGKVTLNGVSSGDVDYDVASLIDVSATTKEYYNFSGYLRNVDLSGSGVRLKAVFTGSGATTKTTAYVTSTEWTRVSINISKEDLAGCTKVEITDECDGADTESFNITGLMLKRITAQEYALATTTIEARYPFAYSKGIPVFDEVISLADRVYCDGILEAFLLGRTVSNLLDVNVAGMEDNTNFSHTNITGADDSSNNLEGTNCMKMTLTDTTGNSVYDAISKVDINEYYLVTSHLLNSDLATGIKLEVETDDQTVSGTDYDGTVYKRVGVVVKPTDFDTATYFNIKFSLTGAIGEFAYADATMLNKVTAYDYIQGADAIMNKYPYHRSIKSVEAGRLKSDNRPPNLVIQPRSLDTLAADGSGSYIRYNRNGSITAHAGSAAAFDADETTIDVISGNKYFVYMKTTEVIQRGLIIFEYSDGTDDNLADVDDPTDLTYGFITATYTGKACLFGRESISATGTWQKADTYVVDVTAHGLTSLSAEEMKALVEVQLKESQAYMPQVLRSTNVADSWDLKTGIAVKRNDEKVLLSGDIDSVADGANLQRAVIGLDAFSNIVTQTTGLDGSTIVSYLVGEASGYDTAGDEGKWYTDASNLYILAALGTWADVAAARTALTSTVITKITFALKSSNYETTQYPPEVLNSWLDGTIENSLVEEEQLIYDNGLFITNTDLPISSLDYVLKVNADGSETPIAISTATINANKLSLTLSGGVKFEEYKFGYYPLFGSTRAELVYSTPNSVKAQEDGNSEGLADVNKKLDNLYNKIEVETQLSNLPPVTATAEACIGIIPVGARIIGVDLVVAENITADNTNYWDFTITVDGNTLVNLDTTITSGTSLTAYTKQDLGAVDKDYQDVSAGTVVKAVLTKNAAAANLNETSFIVKYHKI